MSRKPQTCVSGGKRVTLCCCLALGGVAALLIWLRSSTAFLPFLLIALILLLPTAINLLLLLPRGKARAAITEAPPAPTAESTPPAPADAAPQEPTKKPMRARCKAALGRIAQAIRDFFGRNRTTLTAAVIVLLTVTLNVLFFNALRQKSFSNDLGYVHVVILLALFVLFIVLGKWCKHRVPQEASEDEAKTLRYEIALLRNMQSAFALARLAVLLALVTVSVRLLGLYDFSQWLSVLLSVLFVYKTAFVAISLFVVLVRHELAVAPEITAPAPGVEGGDLGILTYLEKNTGISMRSLWSIEMIKKALPYAALLSVLLLWGVTSVVMVGSNQEGAHYRLGKLQEETLSPGLHLTLPWPFDKVEIYDTKTVGKMTVGYIAEGDADNIWTEAHGGEEYRLLLGGGNELVSINLRVMYRISDLGKYLTSSAAPEVLMSAASYEIVTARTITGDLDTMLSTDRENFAETFREELMGYMAKYETGLEVVSVVLESIHPPVEIADAYQALISAEIEAEKIILDAEAYAGERVAWAYVDYDGTVAMANVDYYQELARARASVAEFMASVEADEAYPVQYRYYKYMQAITEAYSDAKLIIVGDGVNEQNIYIGSIGSGVSE